MTKARRICICGSMAFIDAMEAIANELRAEGHGVHTPVREEVAIDWASLSDEESAILKCRYIDCHFETIKQSDLVLLANYPKNGIDGYIGPNLLMEAALAYALEIPVVSLRKPGPQPCRLEINAISRVVSEEDMGAIGETFSQAFATSS